LSLGGSLKKQVKLVALPRNQQKAVPKKDGFLLVDWPERGAPVAELRIIRRES